MDMNSPLQPGNASKIPIQTQPIQSPVNNQKIFLPIILGVIILLLVVEGGAFYLELRNGQSQQSRLQVQNTVSPTVIPTAVRTPTTTKTSEADSMDQNTAKYINSAYSFSVLFPKYNTFRGDTCDPNQYTSSGHTPLRVFEDVGNNSLYISSETVAEIKFKERPDGGYEGDYNNCKIVDNSLDLIKTGYPNGMTDKQGLHAYKTKPSAFQINYAKVTNDNDLNSLLHTIYGPKCFVSKKEADKNFADVLEVKFADKNGISDFGGECATNFGYLFYYAPKLQVGLITSSFQNPPFQGVDGQSLPKFEFLTK